MIFVTAAAFTAILVAIAIAADRRLGERGNLPMQWTLGGHATWTAPRRFALAFVPVIGIVILFGIALGENGDPTGDGSAARDVQAMIGVALVAGQLLHLWLVRRSLAR